MSAAPAPSSPCSRLQGGDGALRMQLAASWPAGMCCGMARASRDIPTSCPQCHQLPADPLAPGAHPHAEHCAVCRGAAGCQRFPLFSWGFSGCLLFPLGPAPLCCSTTASKNCSKPLWQQRQNHSCWFRRVLSLHQHPQAAACLPLLATWAPLSSPVVLAAAHVHRREACYWQEACRGGGTWGGGRAGSI